MAEIVPRLGGLVGLTRHTIAIPIQPRAVPGLPAEQRCRPADPPGLRRCRGRHGQRAGPHRSRGRPGRQSASRRRVVALARPPPRLLFDPEGRPGRAAVLMEEPSG